jgi:hypothetical protein
MRQRPLVGTRSATPLTTTRRCNASHGKTNDTFAFPEIGRALRLSRFV